MKTRLLSIAFCLPILSSIVPALNLLDLWQKPVDCGVARWKRR